MERLSKRQREILEYLNNKFPNNIEYEVLLEESGGKPGDILAGADIELLKDKELIKQFDGTFNLYLSITPKGREKLQENFKTRLQDAAYNNPWAVIAIVISLILGLITLWK